MTRKEKIKESAEKRTLEIFGELDDFQDRTNGFIEGAKWADSNPQENLIDIEKACNWLKNRISIPYEGNTNENGEPFAGDYIKFAMERLKKAEEFCENFKKAMEE